MLLVKVVEFAMTSIFEGQLIGPILKGQAVQEISVDHFCHQEWAKFYPCMYSDAQSDGQILFSNYPVSLFVMITFSFIV